MPTLREFLQVLCGDVCDVAALEQRARERWPEGRVYIPPANSRKVGQNIGAVARIVESATERGIMRAAREAGITPRTVRRLVSRARGSNP